MNIRRSNIVSAEHLHPDFGTEDQHPASGTRVVPEKPTMEMLTAASIAGGVSVSTVWDIYQAMLKAAPPA